MRGLVQEGFGGPCASRYAVAGVRFRLVRVPITGDSTSTALRLQVVGVAGELDTLVPQLAAPSPPLSVQREVARKMSQVRNGLAHLCFGSDRSEAFTRDPMAFPGTAAPGAFTLLDELMTDGPLQENEVPLGLVSWTGAGVRFLDQWAVRRLVTRAPGGPTWPAACFGPRAALVAMIIQCQQQLTDLAADPLAVGAQIARQWLFYLPPLIWVGGRPGEQQIDPVGLMSGLTVRGPLYVEGARLSGLMEIATTFPARPTDTLEFFWKYLVRENRQASDEGALSSARLFTIIASGHLPDLTNPRFDLARFNYNNIS